jgi:hypothetical protein
VKTDASVNHVVVHVVDRILVNADVELGRGSVACDLFLRELDVVTKFVGMRVPLLRGDSRRRRRGLLGRCLHLLRCLEMGVAGGMKNGVRSAALILMFNGSEPRRWHHYTY